MFDRLILSFEGVKRILLIMAIFQLGDTLLLCGQAFGLASCIVNVWTGEAFLDQLWWVALFAACFIAVRLVRIGKNRTMDDYACMTVEKLRCDYWHALTLEGPVGIAARGPAALAAQAVDGLQSIEEYIRLIIPRTIGVVLIPLVILVVLFCFDWISALIALVCYPFIILFMRLIGSSAKNEANKRKHQFERMSNNFIDTVQGMDTIRAFDVVAIFRNSIFEKSERFRELTMKTLRIAMLSSTILDIFSTLALAAVAIMLGFRLVEGSIAFLPALIVLMLVPDYFKPIKDFGSDYHSTLEGRTSLLTIMDIIDDAKRIPAVILDSDGQGEGCIKGDALELAIDDMAYDYVDAHLEWHDLGLRVQKPCKIGIVGPSGCGKSTLMNMIAGFCDPASGCMNINGESYETLRRASWLKRVSYIPQSPTIFTMSLKDNLTFYEKDASATQIDAALEAVGLTQLVDSLPNGLDTLVGPGQRELSGGEAQRVALARALLASRRDVWILDEPTAHLDIQTECELKERMLPLMEGKLVFMATHRLHWEKDMDVVIHLNDAVTEEIEGRRHHV